jgi:acyl-CoA thioesterase FadM
MRRKWYPVLAATQLRFRRPLNLFQRFEIRTRIVGWDDKWVFIEQKILRKGKLVTHAFLKGAFVGPQGTVPITELVKLIGRGAASPPLPAEWRAWLDAEGAMAEAGRTVRDS